MNEKLKAILLFGQPGVGKGTQGAILGNVPGICHLATGDMLRAAVSAGTEVGLKAKARTGSLPAVRDAQYKRWKWACDNLDTYINDDDERAELFKAKCATCHSCC